VTKVCQKCVKSVSKVCQKYDKTKVASPPTHDNEPARSSSCRRSGSSSGGEARASPCDSQSRQFYSESASSHHSPPCEYSHTTPPAWSEGRQAPPGSGQSPKKSKLNSTAASQRWCWKLYGRSPSGGISRPLLSCPPGGGPGRCLASHGPRVSRSRGLAGFGGGGRAGGGSFGVRLLLRGCGGEGQNENGALSIFKSLNFGGRRLVLGVISGGSFQG